jgi:hypothetical protein
MTRPTRPISQDFILSPFHVTVFFKQTQLAEANRRGIFSEDFDVDAEVAATKGEVPVQGITSVGLRGAAGGANPTL